MIALSSGQIMDAVVQAVAPLLREQRAQIADLERRVVEVEQKGIRYRGTYQRAEQYRPGDLCTHDGSLWVALAETREAPGNGSDWHLAIQRGRDDG